MLVAKAYRSKKTAVESLRPEMDRTRGLRIPETTTPTSMSGRFVRYVLGGPGRNRTTDTRIFKTAAHTFANRLPHQHRRHQGRTALRQIDNARTATNLDEPCSDGPSTVVAGHTTESC